MVSWSIITSTIQCKEKGKTENLTEREGSHRIATPLIGELSYFSN
jgi:hypothetical protein